jgi:hypothetical protein
MLWTTLWNVAFISVVFRFRTAIKNRKLFLMGPISETGEATWKTFVLLVGDIFKSFPEAIEPEAILFFGIVYMSNFVAPVCKKLFGFVFRKENHIVFRKEIRIGFWCLSELDL